MPMHDWTRVDAGIYHAFHHEWISEIGRALNRGLLPGDYYALPEQQAAGFGSDVITLQDITGEAFVSGGTATLARTKPSDATPTDNRSPKHLSMACIAARRKLDATNFTRRPIAKVESCRWW